MVSVQHFCCDLTKSWNSLRFVLYYDCTWDRKKNMWLSTGYLWVQRKFKDFNISFALQKYPWARRWLFPPDKSIRTSDMKIWIYINMRRFSLNVAETALLSLGALSRNVRWESRPEKSLHFLFSSSHTQETLKSILLTQRPLQPGKGGFSLFLRSYVKFNVWDWVFIFYSDLYFALTTEKKNTNSWFILLRKVNWSIYSYLAEKV